MTRGLGDAFGDPPIEDDRTMSPMPPGIGPPPRHDVGGIVLCGGQSRRLGMPKESVRIGGVTLLENAIRIVHEVADLVVVAARPDQRLPEMSHTVEVVRDRTGLAGPLAGIEAGLEALAPRRRFAVVLACDYPLARAETMRLLLGGLVGGAEACVPSVGGRVEPLVSAYQTSILRVCRELVETGERRAWTLAERCGAVVLGENVLRKVDPELIGFRDVDDVESLQWFRRRFGPPPAHD